MAKKKPEATKAEVSPRGRKIEVVGEVVSTKMAKTISVLVFRMIRHKKYGKFLKKTSVFKAHDENQEYHIGDKVVIEEANPISKDKNWIVIRKI
jgi:small subunit ribosomal protein S17